MAPEPTKGVDPKGWLTGSEQEVWRRLLAVQCRLRERLEQELQHSTGLGLAEYDVLVHLSEAPGRSLRMSELAARLLLSKSGLTRRVDRMARNGLVARRPCDEDGRGLLAELTPAGLDALRSAAPVHVEGVRRYLIDPVAATSGLDGLAAGLARVEGALQRGADPDTTSPPRSIQPFVPPATETAS